jgi:DNA polymerase (family 10)
MMENKAIAKHFKLLAQLMELHEENPFKTRSVSTAGFQLDKWPTSLYQDWQQGIRAWEGISNSTTGKLLELFEQGEILALRQLLDQTPTGVVELLQIKGLGPKKVQIIWKQLGIESPGELHYACNENRLIEAKGFGLKTQEEILKALTFAQNNKGWLIYPQALHAVEVFEQRAASWLNGRVYARSGALRRCCEILDGLEWVVVATPTEGLQLSETLQSFYTLLPYEANNTLAFVDASGIKHYLHLCEEEQFVYQWWKTTGSVAHTEQMLALGLAEHQNFKDENALYQHVGLPFIPPELREGMQEIHLAQQQKLPTLIEWKDLKGTLHNHSTYSDGVHSLEQMLLYCKNELSLAYLGICDHSKTAVYAKGMTEGTVMQQWAEIDALNAQYAPFKIFKGIESDILSDGSLDYPDEILAGFDFVVASIHSNLKMDQEKATQRLIRAIENPFTTLLGHPTGRLLLSRPGYPIDFKKVIDACAANGVAIEINANPLRLDLDWRQHAYALEKGVKLSINPDAHRMEGLRDMEFGLLAGRKGGLSASECLNAMSLEEITAYFALQKAKRKA